MAADTLEEVCCVGSLGASKAYSDAKALGNRVLWLVLQNVLVISNVDVRTKAGE
jgi:hypothetical protein